MAMEKKLHARHYNTEITLLANDSDATFNVMWQQYMLMLIAYIESSIFLSFSI